MRAEMPMDEDRTPPDVSHDAPPDAGLDLAASAFAPDSAGPQSDGPPSAGLQSDGPKSDGASPDGSAADRSASDGSALGSGDERADVLVHDLNNLFHIVLAAAEALAQLAPPGTDIHELARITQSAAQRSGVLLDRLAALSEDAGVTPVWADCAEAIVATARLANVATPAAVTVLARGMPAPLACRADRADLESALLNLCVNAAHAMPKGGAIQLSARARRLSPRIAEALGVKPGRYAAVAVRDPGQGMTADVLARATQPRFTTRRGRGGRGLGLAGVAAFARRHGGALDLVSAPGQGTTATLYLPMV